MRLIRNLPNWIKVGTTSDTFSATQRSAPSSEKVRLPWAASYGTYRKNLELILLSSHNVWISFLEFCNFSIWKDFCPAVEKRQILSPSILFKVIIFDFMTLIYICFFYLLIFIMLRNNKSDLKFNFEHFSWWLIYLVSFWLLNLFSFLLFEFLPQY